MQSLWMLVAALFYAVYGVCVKLAGAESIGAWEVLFYRSIAGLAVFAVMLQMKGISPATSHPWAHTIRSVAGVTAIAAGIYSIKHLNLGLATTLNYTAPLFLGAFVVIYSLLHHSRINWGLIGSLVLGFVGVVVLLGPTIGPEEYMPAAIGIGGGMCMALATGFVKRLGTWREPDVRIIFYLMLCGTVVGLVGTLAGSGFSSWTVMRVLWLSLLSVCAILGQFTLTRAFSHGNMVLTGALQYSVILFSSILGVVVFGETVTAAIVTGMVIIVVAGLSASWFTKREQTATGTRLPKR